MIIDRIWSLQPGKYFFLATKSGTAKWNEHFFTRDQFNTIPQFLKDHSDSDIYFCPHGFTKPRRLKTYAVMPNLLWSDMDEADPRTVKIKPTVAIESSPGRFVGLWFTDAPVSESLNRRMSYFLGADTSGWDLTQVLRVPGTTNYKYHTMPRVRVLWTDGPEYLVKTLTSKLPKDNDETAAATEETDAAAVYKKYEKKLPMWCRREILNGKPTAGKQSEMIWKLGNALIEAGLTNDDAFVLLKASPWNKFSGRRNEDQQLQRELDKALNKHLRAAKAKPVVGEDDDDESEESRERGGKRLIFRSMDEVEEENIDWLWYPYIAFGELSILEGDPGLGKSYMMQKAAIHVCEGIKLPTELPGQKPTKGKVLYFDIENSAGTVTKKRLMTNGLVNQKNFIQCEEPFSIDDEDSLDEVYEYIERERPVLVVFDTLNTYMGKADAFKGHEAQQVFVRFREIAKRFDCAVVVLRHLTKSTKERALYRGQGSISFAGLARIVMTVGVSPDDPDVRMMAVTKINVARPPKALSFTIESLPDQLKERDRSRFVWGDFTDHTADDIVSAPPKSGSSDRDDAMAFLEAQLDEGAIEVGKLEKMAESRSISLRTLQRAADSLGVVKKATGFGKDKRSFWSLPGKVDENV